jgi:tetratricopeptide (TPR) repeat protein
MDDVCLKTLKALSVELLPLGFYHDTGEYATKSIEAWKRYINAVSIPYSKEGIIKRKKLFEEAVQIDPEFAGAWSALALDYFFAARYGWSDSRQDSLIKAKELALKSLELDDSIAFTYCILGNINYLVREYDKAMEYYDKAIEVDPNDSWSYYYLARAKLFNGQPEAAIPMIKKSMRMNPHYPDLFSIVLSRSYYFLKQYDEAINVLEKVLTVTDAPKWPCLQLAQIYSELGEYNKARNYLKRVMEYDPSFNLEDRRKQNMWRNPADNDREIEALRKAGAPEHPPSSQ